MNFYIVPAASYQVQQKLEKSKHGKKRSSRHSSKTSTTSDKTDSQSLKSIITYGDSMKSVSETSEDKEEPEFHESVNSANELSNSPTKETQNRTTSVASNEFDQSQHPAPTSLSAMKVGNKERHLSLHSGSSESHKFRRNSSMSFTSLSTSNRHSSSQVRKMSYSQVPTASLSSQPPPGSVDIRPELFSDSRLDGELNAKHQFHIPKYRPITDLSVMNNDALLKKSFYNPSYMVKRYENFLQIFSEHHLGDPINFAAVRKHSLMKFFNRHSRSKSERESSHTIKPNGDIGYYEGLISYELLRCRNFLRRLINMQAGRCLLHATLISCEELLQINFINYIRYLLNLPNVLPIAPENMDEILARHYHFRSFFTEMSSVLYSLKKEGYSDDLTTPTSEFDILLASISKVSYEFIILEKYAIHILVKLNHDSIIEKRICNHLFSLFDLNMKLERTESLKVLNYNTYFSAQYSWYLAITMPFARVFEANIYGEDDFLVADQGVSNKHLATHSEKRDFKSSDRKLYNEYFSRLNLKDSELFSRLSRRELVELQKLAYLGADTISGQALDANGFEPQFKPPNFEYMSNSLSSLESETVHVIHSRDISLQLSPSNFKPILEEFYRLLKKGGILELPLLKSGEHQAEISAKYGISSFPNCSGFMDLDIARSSDIIPNFLDSLLSELSDLFGSKNVKFSPVLLSERNAMNKFLIDHTAMTIYETYGDLDKFCSRFALDETRSDDNERLHYYFYIRAEKA